MFSGRARFKIPTLILSLMSESILSNSSRRFCKTAKKIWTSSSKLYINLLILSFRTIFLCSGPIVKDLLSSSYNWKAVSLWLSNIFLVFSPRLFVMIHFTNISFLISFFARSDFVHERIIEFINCIFFNAFCYISLSYLFHFFMTYIVIMNINTKEIEDICFPVNKVICCQFRNMVKVFTVVKSEPLFVWVHIHWCLLFGLG